MRLREIFTWEKIVDDIRNWSVGLIMSALLAGLIALGLLAWKIVKQQPIPWVILIALLLVAIVLLILAIASVRSQRTSKPNEKPSLFQLRCGTDTYSTNNITGNIPARYLQAEVSANSTIHACRAFLTEIKGGRNTWKGHEQLTFAPSESHDSLSKAIYVGMKFPLDVLLVSSDGEIRVCNQKRDWKLWPRLRDLFSGPGFYDLMISIGGEGGVVAEHFVLRFKWTGNWQTSFLQSGEISNGSVPAQEPVLTGLKLRQRYDDLIARGKDILDRLCAQERAAAIPDAAEWINEVNRFAEANLSSSLADYDSLSFPPHIETFHQNMIESDPSKYFDMIKAEVALKYGRLSVLRNKVT